MDYLAREQQHFFYGVIVELCAHTTAIFQIMESGESDNTGQSFRNIINQVDVVMTEIGELLNLSFTVGTSQLLIQNRNVTKAVEKLDLLLSESKVYEARSIFDEILHNIIVSAKDLAKKSNSYPIYASEELTKIKQRIMDEIYDVLVTAQQKILKYSIQGGSVLEFNYRPPRPPRSDKPEQSSVVPIKSIKLQQKMHRGMIGNSSVKQFATITRNNNKDSSEPSSPDVNQPKTVFFNDNDDDDYKKSHHQRSSSSSSSKWQNFDDDSDDYQVSPVSSSSEISTNDLSLNISSISSTNQSESKSKSPRSSKSPSSTGEKRKHRYKTLNDDQLQSFRSLKQKFKAGYHDLSTQTGSILKKSPRKKSRSNDDPFDSCELIIQSLNELNCLDNSWKTDEKQSELRDIINNILIHTIPQQQQQLNSSNDSSTSVKSTSSSNSTPSDLVRPRRTSSNSKDVPVVISKWKRSSESRSNVLESSQTLMVCNHFSFLFFFN